MLTVKNFEGNVLALIDEDIEDDAALRSLFSLSKVMQASALPFEGSVVEAPFTGSHREHVAGRAGSNWKCSLEVIADIQEQSGGSETTTTLTANADCWCGRLINHPVSMEIDKEELSVRMEETSRTFFHLV